MSPKAQMVFDDFIFQVRIRPAHLYYTPSGCEYRVATEVQRQVFGIVARQFRQLVFAEPLNNRANASPTAGASAHAAGFYGSHLRADGQIRRVLGASDVEFRMADAPVHRKGIS